VIDRFCCDWASPPGDTIQDAMEELGMTKAKLEQHLGKSPEFVDNLIVGKEPITYDIAGILEKLFGNPVGFWMQRESEYRKEQ